MYTNNYQDLKDKITLLMDIFHKLLEDSPDKDILVAADKTHQLARKALVSSENAQEFFQYLQQFDNQQLKNVIRVLNFNLLINNLVEMYFSGLDMPGLEDDGKQGSLNTLKILKDKGFAAEQVIEIINDMFVNLIFTVHPSQITRRSYLTQQNEIIAALKKYDATTVEKEQQAILARIKDLLTLLWFSDEVRDEIPDPIAEANWAISVAENNMWNAIPKLVQQLNENFVTVFGQELALDFSPIKLSSWIGAAYFLNSNLDYHQTKKIICLSYKRGLNLIHTDLEILANELTLNYATPELTKKYQIDRHIYRHIIDNLIVRLKLTQQYYNIVKDIVGPINLEQKAKLEQLKPLIFKSYKDLFEPLQDMLLSLNQLGLSSLSHGLLQSLIIRVKCFGLAIFEYDVVHHADDYWQCLVLALQEHGIDLKQKLQQQGEVAVEDYLIELLQDKELLAKLIPENWQIAAFNYSNQQQELTEQQLELIKDLPIQDGISRKKLANILNSATLNKDYPDLVKYYFLGRAINLREILAAQLVLCAINPQGCFHIVPNFERKESLENIEYIFEKLYQIPGYIEFCDNHQAMMISYSGTIKDSGVITSNWINFKAQEAFIKVSEKYQVRNEIIHGRGGAIGRGGETTHAAILALPDQALKNGLRMIEQGEMVRFKFGTADLCLSTMDYYFSSTLMHNIDKQHPVRDVWRKMMEQLSDISYAEFRKLVHNNKNFEKYYYQATPDREFQHIAVTGLLPKYTNEVFPYSVRDISWLFAWMTNRLILPNWIGSGKAILELLESDQAQDLIAMYRNWKFFNSRIAFIEMIYFKVDLGICQLYEDNFLDDDIKDFAKELHQSLEEENKALTKLTNSKSKSLMVGLPWIAQSIKVRAINSIPMHMLQIEVIKRMRQQEQLQQPIDLELRQAMRITTTAIAGGLRNTG